MRAKLPLFLAALATAAANAASIDPERAADRVIDEANAFRREHRLPTLETNANLGRTARDFAEYMAKTDRFGHEADGAQPADRAKRHGYDYCMVAENIGYQYRSHGFASIAELAGGFVTGWKNSPEHRRNLLDREAIDTGVGLARSPATGRYYAVQLFGRPASKSVKFSVTNDSDARLEYRVGAQRYSLPRRSVRTHETCMSETVSFEGETVTPRTGDHIFLKNGMKVRLTARVSGRLRSFNVPRPVSSR
jgi:uncharacterized protein YkwD